MLVTVSTVGNDFQGPSGSTKSAISETVDMEPCSKCGEYHIRENLRITNFIRTKLTVSEVLTCHTCIKKYDLKWI